MGRFYVTTPIYYTNDAPHVGSAYTTVNADALARWHRLVGDDVLFLTGTDEHGQKVADAAARGGLSPRELADRNAARFQEAWDAISISYDDFIRTTEERHYASVQAFLSTIHENGYIYKGVYQGLYCVSCEDYYTYEASDAGRCPIHGKELVAMEEENWFFRLSAFQERLLEHYESHPGFVTPETKRNEALAFIRGGLHDISITRTSIDWGVPVPWDREHVFYVWYDALINYLTAIGYGVDAGVGRALVAREPPPHRQGDHPLPLRVVAGDADGRRPRAAPPRPRARLAAHRRPEARQDHGRRGRGADLRHLADRARARVRGRPAALLPAARDRAGQRRRVLPRGDRRSATTPTWPTTSATSCRGSPRSWALSARGSGPAPGDGGHLPGVIDDAVRESRAAWDRFAPHDALEATWWIIGAANAHLEANEPWRKEAGRRGRRGARRRARGAARRRGAGVTGDAVGLRRDLAPDRDCPGRRPTRPLEAAVRWGGYPGGLRVERGEPLFPRRDSA